MYEELDKLPLSNNNKQIEYYFIQKWLREQHKLLVYCLPEADDNWYYQITIFHKRDCIMDFDLNVKKLYESALELGLYEALKLIE